VLQLLNTINFGVIRKTRSQLTATSLASRGVSTDTSKAPTAMTVDSRPVVMPQFGLGEPLANVAILHTGGNHYVMLQQVSTPATTDV
jgi:hypothetical protein